MQRSVHIVTHTIQKEQPTLFDKQAPTTPYQVCHFIQFDFWEHDTLVYTKPLYVDTHTRDWHFKSRLIDIIKKEIVQSPSFAVTGWNKREHFNYSYTLQDNAHILHWINPKSIMTLFEIV